MLAVILILALAIIVTALINIIIAISKRLGEKKCPYCFELVKRKATVCKYCGRELES